MPLFVFDSFSRHLQGCFFHFKNEFYRPIRFSSSDKLYLISALMEQRGLTSSRVVYASKQNTPALNFIEIFLWSPGYHITIFLCRDKFLALFYLFLSNFNSSCFQFLPFCCPFCCHRRKAPTFVNTSHHAQHTFASTTRLNSDKYKITTLQKKVSQFQHTVHN